MATFDQTKPSTTRNYQTEFVPDLLANFEALGNMLEGDTITSPYEGLKRYNATSKLFQRYTSGAWAELQLDYAKLSATALAWTGNPTHAGNHTWSGEHSFGADLKFTDSDFRLQAVSSDGADNKRIIISAGGGFSSARGANLLLGGNESSQPGQANLYAGDTGSILLSGGTTAITANTMTWSGNPTHSGDHTWSGAASFSSTLVAAGVTSIGNLTNAPAFSTTDILRVGGSTATSNSGVQINAGANTALSYLHFGDPDARDSGGFQYNHNTDTMVVRAGGASRVTLSSSLLAITPNTSIGGTLDVTGAVDINSTLAVTGTATISGAVRGASGSAATPEYSFVSSTNMGMYRIGSTQLGFSVAGVNAATLDNTGSLTLAGSLLSGIVSGSSGLTLQGSSASVNVTVQSAIPVLVPGGDNTTRLGNTSNRWSVVYAATGTINTSDEREKDITGVTPLGLEFIKALQPVAYRWKQGGFDQVEDDSGNVQLVPRPGTRLFHGFSAQQVHACLPLGVDFAGWTLADKDDPESMQGLRYTEFIAPLVKAVQELSARVEQLEAATIH